MTQKRVFQNRDEISRSLAVQNADFEILLLSHERFVEASVDADDLPRRLARLLRE